MTHCNGRSKQNFKIYAENPKPKVRKFFWKDRIKELLLLDNNTWYVICKYAKSTSASVTKCKMSKEFPNIQFQVSENKVYAKFSL